MRRRASGGIGNSPADAGDDVGAALSEVGDRLLHTLGESRYAGGALIARTASRIESTSSSARVSPSRGSSSRRAARSDDFTSCATRPAKSSSASVFRASRADVLGELLLCRHSVSRSLACVASPRIGAVEERSDRVPGEVSLRDEAERAACVHELRELASGLRRDEDDRRPAVGKPGEPLRDVQAALGAEVHVDERYVRSQGQRLVDGLFRGRGEANHGDPVVSEELPGRLEERRAVVHDQAGERRRAPGRSSHQGGSPRRSFAPDGERPSWGPIVRYT